VGVKRIMREVRPVASDNAKPSEVPPATKQMKQMKTLKLRAGSVIGMIGQAR
jgi:hypothetical protein